MLEKSFGIFFFLKKLKTENVDGMRYVYLRITVDGISKEVSTSPKYPATTSQPFSYSFQQRTKDELHLLIC